MREGSRGAWTALYNGYNVDLWRHVARLLGKDPAGIADIVQEVFLAAARSAKNFDPDRGTLWNWLTGIAHFQVAAYWRQISKANRLKQLVEEGAFEISHYLDASKSNETTTQSVDLADVVRSVLAQIPADYAALLTAKYIDDQSLDALAHQVGGGISVEAIKSKLARARREFRSKFEQIENRDHEATKTSTRCEPAGESALGDHVK